MSQQSNETGASENSAQDWPHLVAGKPCDLETTLNAAAQVLSAARRPAILVGHYVTLEAAGAAVRLAEALGAIIDSGQGHRIPSRGTSFQVQGEARATGGEYRNADLVVAVVKNDTLLKLGVVNRCAPNAQIFIIEVGSKTSFSYEQLRDGEVSESIAATLAPIERSALQRCKVEDLDELQLCLDELIALGRQKWERFHARANWSSKPSDDAFWKALHVAWQGARLPLLAFDPNELRRSFGDTAAADCIEMLEAIVLQKARDGRAAAISLETGNGRTLEYALTARTGYPDAVDFSSGRAEFAPWRTSLEAALAREEVDCLFVVGNGLPFNMETPLLAKNYHGDELLGVTEVCKLPLEAPIALATPPIHEVSGTFLEPDGIPRIVQVEATSTLPSLAEILEALLQRVLSATEASAR